jgi:CHAT domain-containing protein
MISFHRNRTLGSLTSVESLRKAQLEMLKTEKFAHPNYWSAFSLSGGFTEY